MHGSRQEGAGWGGVEINLSNTKSKKKKASERPPPHPTWANTIIPPSRENNSGSAHVICISIKSG